ncbi:MAG: tRNA pseudouridine(13) synthase TruD, partial [Planctomycetota bacterium]
PRVPWARRSAAADGFVVDELSVECSDAGEDGSHLWFTVQKRGVSTPEAARRIARALGLPPVAVGFAGRKDARAITRQRMSVEHVEPDALLAVDVPGIRIRDVQRARTKLRLGDLEGNRFHLRLDGAAESDAPRTRAALVELAEDGLPNAYGPQRFGAEGRGWEIGRLLCTGPPLAYLGAIAADDAGRTEAGLELVRRIESGSPGERRRATELGPQLGPELKAVAHALVRKRSAPPEDLVRAVPKRARSFHVSMLQAYVFNRVLARRVADGTWGTLLPGDVAAELTFGPAPRAVPTGPIWSPRMRRAEDAPAAVELEELRAVGLEPEDLGAPGGLTPRGARRPLVAELRAPECVWRDDVGALWISFELPPGSYATVVLDALGTRALSH